MGQRKENKMACAQKTGTPRLFLGKNFDKSNIWSEGSRVGDFSSDGLVVRQQGDSPSIFCSA